MPAAISQKTYESAAMTDCDAMEGFRSAGFGKKDLSLCGRYSGYLEAREPGAFFTFRFTGTRLGFYGMLAADSGDMLVSVDGGPEKTVRMWDTYCLSFSRAGGFFAETDLPEGCHTVTVRAAETKAEQSEGHAIRISAVLTA